MGQLFDLERNGPSSAARGVFDFPIDSCSYYLAHHARALVSLHQFNHLFL
jgi:hypothetical protein